MITVKQAYGELYDDHALFQGVDMPVNVSFGRVSTISCCVCTCSFVIIFLSVFFFFSILVSLGRVC